MLNAKTIQFLEKPVAIEPLVVFRILFGALMVISTVRFMALGWIDDHYIKPLFHFKYFGFGWVDVLPAYWMYAIHFVMIAAAFGVLVGFYYRISAALLFLIFTYTELIDLTYYLNHYYFVSIMCGLMIILPAHRSFSFDAIRKGEEAETIPNWVILLIKFQLAIVYFYAGIAKINYDWLIQALPMRIWMPAGGDLPLIGSLLTIPLMPWVFSWMGMLYDCTIVFFLSNQKTRPFAYASVVFFHAVTGMMFQIGVFPLVMIAATLVFFHDSLHKKVIAFLRSIPERINISQKWVLKKIPSRVYSPVIKYALIAFVVFQVLFPWRYVLYPGNLFWTEEGYRFSWRVMLMEKAGTATFYVKDKKTGREGIVVNNEFLNAHQEKQMAMQPDMILQFAHFLKNHYSAKGMEDPEVRAEVYVTLNARPSQLLLDPSVNLAQVQDGWKAKSWIKRYQE